MGVSHSQDRAAFFNAGAPWDGDQVDIARYIWRVESTLWRMAPPWAPLMDVKGGGENTTASPRSSQRAKEKIVDPWKKLVRLCHGIATAVLGKRSLTGWADVMSWAMQTMQEAFELVPTMLSDSWVSPLVAFVDSTEGVVQSAALALLAKVLTTGRSAVDIRASDHIQSALNCATLTAQTRRWRSSTESVEWTRSWLC
jgi:hypothetical protein